MIACWRVTFTRDAPTQTSGFSDGFDFTRYQPYHFSPLTLLVLFLTVTDIKEDEFYILILFSGSGLVEYTLILFSI